MQTTGYIGNMDRMPKTDESTFILSWIAGEDSGTRVFRHKHSAEHFGITLYCLTKKEAEEFREKHSINTEDVIMEIMTVPYHSK